MNQVLTTKGLIEFGMLDVRDVVEVGDNYRKIATEYRLGEELVRRDVAVSALRGLESQAAEGQLHG